MQSLDAAHYDPYLGTCMLDKSLTALSGVFISIVSSVEYASLMVSKSSPGLDCVRYGYRNTCRSQCARPPISWTRRNYRTTETWRRTIIFGASSIHLVSSQSNSRHIPSQISLGQCHIYLHASSLDSEIHTALLLVMLIVTLLGDVRLFSCSLLRTNSEDLPAQ